MQHIKSLTLKKSMCFNNVKFDFEPGVSVIYGLNKTERSSTNSNAAGKSAFFSQLGEILYQNPIVGHKKDAVKVGTRSLGLHRTGRDIEIAKVGTHFAIKVDGEARKFRTKALANEWVKKAWPISEEEFNTYVYLDSRIPHPLVMGSSTERRRFFNSFFGLDKLDIEKKLFIAEFDKLKKIRSTYDDLLVEYRTISKGLDGPEAVTEREASIKDLETINTELHGKNQKVVKITQLLAFEASAGPQIKALDAACAGAISEEAFEEVYKTAKWNLKHNTEGLEAAQAWAAYQKDNQRYIKAWDALPGPARVLIKKLGYEKARSKCDAKARHWRSVDASLALIRPRLAECKSQAAIELPKRPERVAESEGELLTLEKRLEHQLEHALKFKRGVCGTCGQDVKAKDPAGLKEELKVVADKLRLIERAKRYSEAKIIKAEAADQVDKLVTESQELIQEKAEIQRYVDIVDAIRDMPTKPSPYTGKKYEVAVKQRMVDEDRERLQLLRFIQPNLRTVIEIKALTEAQRVAAAKAGRLQERINSNNEKLSKLLGARAAYDAVAAQVTRLRSKLKDLKARLKDEEYIKICIEAYSDKAMKKMAVQAISDKLVMVINQYARSVFPEDYQFEFNWDTSELAFLVHRKYAVTRNGKTAQKVLTSDVRKLSGAESKLFTFVLVFALLTFVPDRKRCNILVLDEPSANFSKETTAAFQELLPILNKIVPTIIIITPKTEERYVGASEFTLVKTKGSAIIVPGHPTQIKH